MNGNIVPQGVLLFPFLKPTHAGPTFGHMIWEFPRSGRATFPPPARRSPLRVWWTTRNWVWMIPTLSIKAATRLTPLYPFVLHGDWVLVTKMCVCLEMWYCTPNPSKLTIFGGIPYIQTLPYLPYPLFISHVSLLNHPSTYCMISYDPWLPLPWAASGRTPRYGPSRGFYSPGRIVTYGWITMNMDTGYP